MKQRTHSLTPITEVRELANRFDAATLTQCMEQALQGKYNPCYSAAAAEEVISVLAKAAFVKKQMQQGLLSAEAIRELGKRIRSIQGS